MPKRILSCTSEFFAQEIEKSSRCALTIQSCLKSSRSYITAKPPAQETITPSNTKHTPVRNGRAIKRTSGLALGFCAGACLVVVDFVARLSALWRERVVEDCLRLVLVIVQRLYTKQHVEIPQFWSSVDLV